MESKLGTEQNDFSEKDFIEIIDKKEGQPRHTIFRKEKEAEAILKTFVSDLRLDFHGVLGSLPPEVQVINKKIREKMTICVISYVGKMRGSRMGARLEIMKRISCGQVDFGILVFNRAKKGDTNKNTFTEAGSKAWTNKLIGINGKALFIDDGDDHIQSVESLQLPNLRTIKLEKNIKLLKILQDYYLNPFQS